MNRGGVAGAGAVLLPGLSLGLGGCTPAAAGTSGETAKNIIFLVSDGMSQGTLSMADNLLRTKYGKTSAWVDLYRNGVAKRAMMDTASADSLVTDSAAGGSAWGGGVRVPNGKINTGKNGEKYTPVLQKFKKLGKAVGCVTTVPITHATPASFCVNMKHRKFQAEIAEKYLDLKFDVMLGGGSEYFDAQNREDGRDMFAEFKNAGFHVCRNKKELNSINPDNAPLLGVFHEGGLPYSIDAASEGKIAAQVPGLSEMTKTAIDKMKNNAGGFVLQVEGGKVDWAAHGNDGAAILHDQIEFDRAVQEALNFADADGNTLVIITTDHGNANPGLVKTKNVNKKFERFIEAKHSNEWIFKKLDNNSTVNQIRERVEYAANCPITKDEAKILFDKLQHDAEGEYNPYKKPFAELAAIQYKYWSIGWNSTNHTQDFVELAAYGPGSEALPQFIINSDLHNFMLKASGADARDFVVQDSAAITAM